MLNLEPGEILYLLFIVVPLLHQSLEVRYGLAVILDGHGDVRLGETPCLREVPEPDTVSFADLSIELTSMDSRRSMDFSLLM